MNAPATVFQLGRMRHLDLLALYLRLRPDTYHDPAGIAVAGRLSKERLIAAILQAPG